MDYSSDWLARAQLLMQQSRPDQAASELRRHLTRDPHEPVAHALLAVCLLDEEAQLPTAQQEAELAIHLAPEYDFAFYALALVQHRQHRLKEAMAAINQALALDPTDANYHHLLGSLRLQSGQLPAALQAARTGLSFDSEHAGLHSLEARTLARQGHGAAASAAARAALGHGAESSSVQAQAGWVALETNRPAEALENFREALRLDPTSEFARQGLVEALKARHWVYRTFMRFMYWVSSLGARLRLGLFIGAYAVAHFVPVLLPVYLVFAYLSWFKDALFNSLLRVNRYGRYALSPAQTLHSTHFLALLGLAAAAGLGMLLLPVPGLGTLAFVALGLLFPLVGTERLAGQPQRQRYSRWAGWALAAVGALSVALAMLGLDSDGQLYNQLFMTFLYGTVAYTWLFALS
ncbi:tetratricopeptide repeat protein [Hymenobacter sp. H14-R3]|uniref:tetratricopeptide repeat protein n=1 Tax=Hymenobacter sp. H14-R3 TaxID=3046308 RepID=UPI0024B8B8A1|nr:tetratricopeptide repeat protein [Hymenobacter sp. H14-R3]MDJ0365123.1 tetratricopeptide repeat protein [Hymenobacter sp. H14-R3]